MTNSKELKEKLFGDLEWGIDWRGSIFIPVSDNSIDWEWDAKGIGEILADKEQFEEIDYQEIKQKVLRDVKASPTEWKFDSAICWWDKKEGTKMNEYSVLRSLENSKRVYYKLAFNKQEWQEIEQALPQQQTQQVEQSKPWLPFYGNSNNKH